jgi:hypothetical protein
MDAEEDINMVAEKILKDITASKLDALNMLLVIYQRYCIY